LGKKRVYGERYEERYIGKSPLEDEKGATLYVVDVEAT
jgi:hypothetical protein